ncbi:AlpA family transcriptional regulator [Paraferrimonas sp. SM1919]|uniref:helix-turn-helix transcriptional regulator n=1 Tax=Paraferrimonas sp. SM1919 TaxID=2662263 RepID=UPI0013D214B3|nr:MerR family DNA-binding transcriptional regulator [Paraferrimonas sp. SM1919]
MAAENFISIKEVAKRLGKSVSTVRRYAQNGYLPEPIKKNGKIHSWRESQIDLWMSQSQPFGG